MVGVQNSGYIYNIEGNYVNRIMYIIVGEVVQAGLRIRNNLFRIRIQIF